MYGYITDHHIDENGNDRDFIYLYFMTISSKMDLIS